MPIISVRQLQPGMVVAAPVTNFLGDDLLKSGAVLTVKNIVTLKSWGVKSVAVLGKAEENSLSHEEGSSSARCSIDDLERQFASVKHQPVMQMIYEIVKKQALNSEGDHDGSGCYRSSRRENGCTAISISDYDGGCLRLSINRRNYPPNSRSAHIA